MSANFNLANQDNVLANASRKQLNEWSVKVRLNPDRTARGSDCQKFWNDKILPKIAQRAIVLTAGFNVAFNQVEDLRNLHRDLRKRFEDPDGFLLSNLTTTASA